MAVLPASCRTDIQKFYLALAVCSSLCFFLSIQDALAPRAARNTKSYAEANEPERSNKRKKKGSELQEPQERVQKRRKAEFSVPSVPFIDGASAQVRDWSYGNLSKRDATRFYRAVWFMILHCYFIVFYPGMPHLITLVKSIHILVICCFKNIAFKVFCLFLVDVKEVMHLHYFITLKQCWYLLYKSRHQNWPFIQFNLRDQIIAYVA